MQTYSWYSYWKRVSLYLFINLVKGEFTTEQKHMFSKHMVSLLWGTLTRVKRQVRLVEQELLTLSILVGLCCTIFGYLCRILSIIACLFCPVLCGHCIVCPSYIYNFWVPLWYLQTFLVPIHIKYEMLGIVISSTISVWNDVPLDTYLLFDLYMKLK